MKMAAKSALFARTIVQKTPRKPIEENQVQSTRKSLARPNANRLETTIAIASTILQYRVMHSSFGSSTLDVSIWRAVATGVDRGQGLVRAAFGLSRLARAHQHCSVGSEPDEIEADLRR